MTYQTYLRRSYVTKLLTFVLSTLTNFMYGSMYDNCKYLCASQKAKAFLVSIVVCASSSSYLTSHTENVQEIVHLSYNVLFNLFQFLNSMLLLGSLCNNFLNSCKCKSFSACACLGQIEVFVEFWSLLIRILFY